MSAFKAVSELFQDQQRSVEAANRLDAAYAKGVGHPEYHKKFGADEPEKVAANLAGLYAADAAANGIAAFQCGIYGGKVNEVDYMKALSWLAESGLTETELFIAMNIANATWRATQPFRDMTTKPLGRLSRPVNMQINELPPEERKKDLVQLAEGANILLEAIDEYFRQKIAA